jgi:fumarate reductase subunit D
MVIVLVVGVSFALGLLASNYHDRVEAFFSRRL